MIDHRFDRTVMTLAAMSVHRRNALALLPAALAAVRGGRASGAAVTCLDVGQRCRNRGECCSDVCKGKKGRKRCQAHDAGSCRTGQMVTGCRGELVSCTSSTGHPGRCETTTGNAPYCAGGGDCYACAKDADCQAVCGRRAACVKCSTGCDTAGTQCVGPNDTVCPL